MPLRTKNAHINAYYKYRNNASFIFEKVSMASNIWFTNLYCLPVEQIIIIILVCGQETNFVYAF